MHLLVLYLVFTQCHLCTPPAVLVIRSSAASYTRCRDNSQSVDLRSPRPLGHLTGPLTRLTYSARENEDRMTVSRIHNQPMYYQPSRSKKYFLLCPRKINVFLFWVVSGQTNRERKLFVTEDELHSNCILRSTSLLIGSIVVLGVAFWKINLRLLWCWRRRVKQRHLLENQAPHYRQTLHQLLST